MKQAPMLRIILLTAVAFSLIVFSACKSKPPVYPSETREVLGTTVTVTLYDKDQKVDSVQRVFDQVFATMSHWEQMTMSEGEKNELKKIANSAGTQSVTIDPEVFELIMAATRLHDQSGKLFDIRIGPLYDAWGFSSTPHVPDSTELAQALDLVQNAGMFVAGKSILLAKDGMSFDLRYIIEGYVFDLVAKQLKELGFTDFTIASPTVFLAEGKSPNIEGFEMPLHNPFSADSSWAELFVPPGAYAYLSPVFNQFKANGKLYHSLIHPITGMPADNLAGSIVHADNAATAEAMAFALFMADEGYKLPEEAQKLIKGSIKIKSSNGKFTSEGSGTLAKGIEHIH